MTPTGTVVSATGPPLHRPQPLESAPPSSEHASPNDRFHFADYEDLERARAPAHLNARALDTADARQVDAGVSTDRRREHQPRVKLLRELLQPARGVDGIAGGRQRPHFPVTEFADHHRAGVDPDAEVECLEAVPLEPLIEARHAARD